MFGCTYRWLRGAHDIWWSGATSSVQSAASICILKGVATLVLALTVPLQVSGDELGAVRIGTIQLPFVYCVKGLPWDLIPFLLKFGFLKPAKARKADGESSGFAKFYTWTNPWKIVGGYMQACQMIQFSTQLYLKARRAATLNANKMERLAIISHQGRPFRALTTVK